MTILVLSLVVALIAWFVFRWLRGRANTPVAGADPLDHDRGGVNRALPGQAARTEGEVQDAARSHVGGHLEQDAEVSGTAATADVTASGAKAAATNRDTTSGDAMDPDTASRAARDARDTGGTGAAVLAGIAAAGGVASAAGSASSAGSASEVGDTSAAGRASAGGGTARRGSASASGGASAADAPVGGKSRGDVREMIKILNLRDADATRLDISKEDFQKLWQGDESTSSELVDDVAVRLRRMIG